jgi:hypothetical protein
LIEIKENIAQPIIGKTYSLYGGKNSSDNFYDQLTESTDEILELFGLNIERLLAMTKALSQSMPRIKKGEKKDPFIFMIMKILRRDFSIYLVNVEDHLRSLGIKQLWEKTLSTSREQYLLYMLEIELTNRIYFKKFLLSEKKLAFLPHCLRDFSKTCLAYPDEIDNLCKGCSKKCTVNKISKMLRKNEVTPYIWMNADLKKVFADYRKQNIKIGVLGIACIPELVSGMRLCEKQNVPAVGIPLDANRCSRWMGEFYNNSVNISNLEKLLDSNDLSQKVWI